MEHAVRVAPGLALLGVCLALLPGPRLVAARIGVLIAGFLLIRDAMTPVGLWTFAVADGWLPWLRFVDDGGVLLGLGLISAGAAAALPRLDREVGALVVWGRFDPSTVGLGVAGAMAIAGPVLVLGMVSGVAVGGGVRAGVLPAIAVLALAGNLLEEVLFRGAMQGYLERVTTAVRAAVLSGLLFAGGHVFLASTVTDLGWPVLVFTAYEGLVCAGLRLRHGVIAAALAHGGAIFLLASGLG